MYYRGPSREDIERIQLKDLLEDRVGQYYLTLDNKVIVIPAVPTQTDNPQVFELRSEQERKKDRKQEDDRVEEYHHFNMATILRNENTQSFTIMGFNTNELVKSHKPKKNMVRASSVLIPSK